MSRKNPPPHAGMGRRKVTKAHFVYATRQESSRILIVEAGYQPASPSNATYIDKDHYITQALLIKKNNGAP